MLMFISVMFRRTQNCFIWGLLTMTLASILITECDCKYRKSKSSENQSTSATVQQPSSTIGKITDGECTEESAERPSPDPQGCCELMKLTEYCNLYDNSSRDVLLPQIISLTKTENMRLMLPDGINMSHSSTLAMTRRCQVLKLSTFEIGDMIHVYHLQSPYQGCAPSTCCGYSLPHPDHKPCHMPMMPWCPPMTPSYPASGIPPSYYVQSVTIGKNKDDSKEEDPQESSKKKEKKRKEEPESESEEEYDDEYEDPPPSQRSNRNAASNNRQRRRKSGDNLDPVEQSRSGGNFDPAQLRSVNNFDPGQSRPAYNFDPSEQSRYRCGCNTNVQSRSRGNFDPVEQTRSGGNYFDQSEQSRSGGNFEIAGQTRSEGNYFDPIGQTLSGSQFDLVLDDSFESDPSSFDDPDEDYYEPPPLKRRKTRRKKAKTPVKEVSEDKCRSCKKRKSSS